MNQHSERGGQANGNGVDKVRRVATRPAAVVAIVLCVGLAAAMVAVWAFREPQSHQEIQTQPKAAVQTKTPEPDNKTSEPETVSNVWEPNRAASPERSTAAPVSQVNPAGRQLTDGQVNSPASVQNANSPTPVPDDSDFSHDLNGETITFEAINPMTKVPGRMTVTISGNYRAKLLSDGDGQSSVGSHIQADQQAAFVFAPYDRYSPTYSATARRLQLAGDSTDDSIHFDFGISTTAPDGSSLRFALREVVTVTEDAATVSFEQLK